MLQQGSAEVTSRKRVLMLRSQGAIRDMVQGLTLERSLDIVNDGFENAIGISL